MCAGRSEWMDWRKGEAGITGVFGIPGESDNGRRVMEFCAVTRTLSTRACISTQGWQGAKME